VAVGWVQEPKFRMPRTRRYNGKSQNVLPCNMPPATLQANCCSLVTSVCNIPRSKAISIHEPFIYILSLWRIVYLIRPARLADTTFGGEKLGPFYITAYSLELSALKPVVWIQKKTKF